MIDRCLHDRQDPWHRVLEYLGMDMTLMRSGELGQRLYLVKHERAACKRGDMGGAGWW